GDGRPRRRAERDALRGPGGVECGRPGPDDNPRDERRRVRAVDRDGPRVAGGDGAGLGRGERAPDPDGDDAGGRRDERGRDPDGDGERGGGAAEPRRADDIRGERRGSDHAERALGGGRPRRRAERDALRGPGGGECGRPGADDNPRDERRRVRGGERDGPRVARGDGAGLGRGERAPDPDGEYAGGRRDERGRDPDGDGERGGGGAEPRRADDVERRRERDAERALGDGRPRRRAERDVHRAVGELDAGRHPIDHVLHRDLVDHYDTHIGSGVAGGGGAGGDGFGDRPLDPDDHVDRGRHDGEPERDAGGDRDGDGQTAGLQWSDDVLRRHERDAKQPRCEPRGRRYARARCDDYRAVHELGAGRHPFDLDLYRDLDHRDTGIGSWGAGSG